MSPATSTSTQTTVVYRPDARVGELPILVGLLAVLIGLFGLFWIVVGVLILLSWLGLLAYPMFFAVGVIGSATVVTGALTLIFGVVLMVVATGLWDLETWALYLTGFVVAAVIALLVLAGSFGLGLLVSVGLFVYLVAVSPHFY
ncbi:MAG: hypothetical protein ACYDFT_08775 [Thermoplasmata archaeon]